ncbi:MAG TPA: arylamine N-acetyltransferase [Caulobacteraceae bacterium]
MADFDLDAYFARIGYGGPATPTLDTLTAIQALQVASIPFENLNPLLGLPVKLDLESLQAKLVGRRRGGYCFELNGLFKAALEAIGFRVTGLAARVRWMSPPDAPLSGRSHMLMQVDLADGPWLADAGFGAHLLDSPLKLRAGSDQSTPWANYRLTEADGAFTLAARVADVWRATYIFCLEPQLTADYETYSWFTATHPQSLFVSTLIAERLTETTRYNLVNTRLTERGRDGSAVERTLTTAAELGEVLEAVFNIEPPEPVEAVFAKLAAN